MVGAGDGAHRVSLWDSRMCVSAVCMYVYLGMCVSMHAA